MKPVLMYSVRTRHSLEFDPLTGSLNPALSPYVGTYDDYPMKRRELAQLVGTESFLWCIPATRKFSCYEPDKPVEWEIKVHDNRVIGFVHEERWSQYLEGTYRLLRTVFSASTPPAAEYSVLVQFPLREEELVHRTVFRYISAMKADVMCEQEF